MKRQVNFYQVIEEICAIDKRYKPDSYEFVMQALHFTQKKLNRQKHVTARELLEGIREFAIEQYGPMSQTVLKHWGITKTDDFGNIVFNMIHKNLLSKTEGDTIADFKDVYDFEIVFANILRDSVIRDK
jgi:uncharacterized repeat protein (TIGR04138 family)